MRDVKFWIARDLWFIRIREEIKVEHDVGFGPTYVWDVPEDMARRLVAWLLKAG